MIITILLLTLIVSCSCNENTTYCIFGNSKDCFFPCRCQISICDPDLSQNCQTCHPLTGRCHKDFCQHDEFMFQYYIRAYWDGTGCQIGNVAADNKVNGVTPVHRSGITDETFAFYRPVAFHSAQDKYSIQLNGLHAVEFVDVFLHKTVDPSTFLDNFEVSLHNNDKNYPCVPANILRYDILKKPLPYKISRVHLKCQDPSVGQEIRITHKLNPIQSILQFPYYLNISELVAVGQKYVKPVEDTGVCLESSTVGTFQLCIKCNDSLPPDCKRKCPVGYSGVNCGMLPSSYKDDGNYGDEEEEETIDTSNNSSHQNTLPQAQTNCAATSGTSSWYIGMIATVTTAVFTICVLFILFLLAWKKGVIKIRRYRPVNYNRLVSFTTSDAKGVTLET